MAPGLRKAALAAHVAFSVGFPGAVAAFLALASIGLGDGSVYGAANVVARLVILPLGVAALASGIVSSVGSPWGLVGYYWVVAKLGLTLVALVVLLLQMPTIAMLAGLPAHGAPGAAFAEARMAMVIHSAGGLIVLMLPLLLSIYKPEGRLDRHAHVRRS